MTTKVIMPQMGESIFEGTITKWLKKVGETVARDEPLFEISTEKVDSEIPAPSSGVLAEILVPEGQTVQVNTVVAVIDGPQRKDEPPPAPVSEREATSPEPPVAEHPQAVPAEPPPAPPSPAPVAPQDIRTSPLVRRLARENNIDLSKIQGSGLEGRITKDDVLKYIEQQSTIHAAVPEQPPPQPPSPPKEQAPAAVAPPMAAPTGIPETPETVPMTPMRRAIAEHMVLSKRTSAHVNTVFEIDLSAIVKVREQYQREFEKREGIKLTYTPFFVKALVDCVREFPVFNSSVSGDNIIYRKPINVGIAVALENGLIVPVIRDAHLKSFTGLALAIHDLADRARTKRLKPDDVQNGTISITNPGIFGALFGTPIINQPQVAILGIGGVERRPVVVNDAIGIRSMVYLSLTFDHRVIDGAVADQFMARLKEKLQIWDRWVE